MTAATTPTREQILHLLKKYGALSANDIAERLQITDIAIRRHLNNLEKDDLIRPELMRQSMGRPTNVYSLTEQGNQLFPRHYSDITLDFLRDLEQMNGRDMIDSLFERREERLKDKYKERVQGDFDRRVEQLAAIQNERGYMVDLKKDEQAGDYLLTEHNCPIHDIAHSFNKACSSELSLFRKVLGAEVEQLECKAKGGQRCVYAIRPKLEKPADSSGDPR